MDSVRPSIPELEQFLSCYPPHVVETAHALRALVLCEAPEAVELVYDGCNAVALGYTFSGRLKEAFCRVAVYANHVNLGFNRGAELVDPDGELKGTGNQVRHLTAREPEGAEDPRLRHFLRAAIADATARGEGPDPAVEPRSVLQGVAPTRRRPSA